MVTLGFVETESANLLEVLMMNYRSALEIVLGKLLSPTTAVKLKGFFQSPDYVYGSNKSISLTALCSVLFVLCYVDVLKKEYEMVCLCCIRNAKVKSKQHQMPLCQLLANLCIQAPKSNGAGRLTDLAVFKVSRQLIYFKQKLGLQIMWKKNKQKGNDADLAQ
ncbi:NADPH-dependent butanol dehydrogenase Bdh2 [Striga asiatica]|uniref:NADPH-dependent butanol dehydrogenase Bdh2 n=1 Tax=Striga asiatica TaxID=4170 RepID=A0A5A7QQA7_STRAF|nr:NADPH-dependent butanol dehydrogenase Bdh2 [Striga asiatica]